MNFPKQLANQLKLKYNQNKQYIFLGVKIIKGRDKAFIAAITTLCLMLIFVFAFSQKGGDTVLVYKESKLYKELSLDKNQTLDIDGGNTIVIKDGCAYMQYADCPDKLCIKQGKISDSSRDIVCLPNRVSVRITKKSATDAVAK